MKKSKDIEYLVQQALSPHVTAYCRPLPANYSLPNILVSQVGGASEVDWGDTPHLDMFAIVIDSRAEDEATALDTLNTAVALLRTSNVFRRVTLNTAGSWGADPVRPDLAMCSARLEVTVSLDEVEV